MLHFLATSAYCIMKPNKCLKQRHRWRRIFGETKGGGGGTPKTWDNGEKTLKIFQHPLILHPVKLPRKVCPCPAVRARPENREPGSPRPPQAPPDLLRHPPAPPGTPPAPPGAAPLVGGETEARARRPPSRLSGAPPALPATLLPTQQSRVKG